ncbi:bacterial alpha-L-rhamnosidase-domain-containing protein [Aspergillus carlsbadensis]|nr:bacterial alpha-L-rhamnosidase-domain-containing protein [Aspergillus carlsbadensis]
MTNACITDVRFEHYPASKRALGVDDFKPRISWRFIDVESNFEQTDYEIEVSRGNTSNSTTVDVVHVSSSESYLVPWPQPNNPLVSRDKCSVRVRAWGKEQLNPLPWSDPAEIEVGLLQRDDWKGNLISAPWSGENLDKTQPEDLFRKEFSLSSKPVSARLYITALGVYEAEINGKRVGDHFMAPGWTSYHDQLHYQTFDVTDLLDSNANCLGIRVAEGWYKGRIGFVFARNFYGSRTGVLAQLEVTYEDGNMFTLGTDGTWTAHQGPIQQAEIYDGEVYDARAQIEGWSNTGTNELKNWKAVDLLPPLPAEQRLVSGSKPPVRRLETVTPQKVIKTPSGKVILDFGQNLVGHLRVVKGIRAPAGHKLILQHAEVLEDGELGLRPLRACKAHDTYIFRGDAQGEKYQPRFTFHGFRYAQVDGWPADEDIITSIAAVVCNSDMEEAGTFQCSNNKVNQLFSNTKWSMRGNFFSLPTDCPQRDERLGWTGDLALFAPTATLIYQCVGVLKDWLLDVAFDQGKRGGVPPMVSPNCLAGIKTWGDVWPCAVWHDVAVLAPWALWEETKDVAILQQQYESMTTWLKVIPRNKDRLTHLWDLKGYQLGDWLDPNAPPDDPQKAVTDPTLVANAFLARCLTLMARTSTILGHAEDASYFGDWYIKARDEFVEEYVSPSGRLVSDSQTAYALAICFDLLSPTQTTVAGNRLAEIVRANQLCIGTGFAGTPFVCEALARTGHADTAYAMLLNEKCPSWLYPISMGATTIWERWDSMRPDGSINPGEMTSFNHYAFGAVSKFLVERLAGLQRVSPGWTRSRVEPLLGGWLTSASASHVTPYGVVSVSWTLEKEEKSTATGEMGEGRKFTLDVVVPPTTAMEVVLPSRGGETVQVVGSGKWSFSCVV